MSIIEAIVLGITQGLTEFLPISSSGHLILVPWLLNWDQPSLEFSAALHLGTLTAVFAYFWRDLLAMARALPYALTHFRELLRGAAVTAPDDSPNTIRETDARLALLIVLGSVPGGIAGLAGAEAIDEFFHDAANTDTAVAVVALFLIGFGVLLYLADLRGSQRRGIRQLKVKDALVIGLAQMLALLPGVSRSGVTMTAGLFREMRREDAARFSFLLGVPLISAAGLFSLIDILQASPDRSDLVTLAVGILASAASGFAAIWGLLRFLQQSSTFVFMVYRIVAGASVLVILALGLR